MRAKFVELFEQVSMKNELEGIINKNISKIPKVPLSFLLSGGLDSSLVLALIRKIYPDLPIMSFSLGTKNHPDLINAKKMSELFRTKHKEIILTSEEFNQFSSEFNNIKQSNFNGDVYWYILCSYAKEFSNIIVTGDGGDECFGGYWLHQFPLGHKENGVMKSFEEIHPRPKAHLENMIKLGFRNFYFKEKSTEEDFNTVWEYYISRLGPDHLDIISYIAKDLGVSIYSPLCSSEVISFMRSQPYTERVNKKIERELATLYLPNDIISREKLALNVALEKF